MPPTHTDPKAAAETVFLIVTLEPVRFMEAPIHLFIKSFVHPQPSQSVHQRERRRDLQTQTYDYT